MKYFKKSFLRLYKASFSISYLIFYFRNSQKFQSNIATVNLLWDYLLPKVTPFVLIKLNKVKIK